MRIASLNCLLISSVLLSCNESPRMDKAMVAGASDASQPKVLGEGIISTGEYETHAAFTPTGDTVYFLKCMPDLSTCTICVSYKKEKQWSTPEIAPFSGKYLDVDPFVTNDGKTIYFVSNRPYRQADTINGSWDIWKSQMTGDRWGDPVHLDSPVNSSADEYYPTLADNGTIYFGSYREGGKGGSDIYRCKLVKGSFSLVENLGDSINTAENEYEPFIAPDESYLLFMATKPRGLVNADFYWSKQRNGAWSQAMKVEGPANSPVTEWAPKVTRDGRYFYFGSTRNRLGTLPARNESMPEFQKRIHQSGNGLGDIYYMDFSALPLKNKK